MKSILRINGVDYELKYSIDSLCYMNSFGYNPMDLGSMILDIRTTRFLLYVGLKSAIPSLTEEKAGDLLDDYEQNSIENIRNIIINTLIYDMGYNDESGDGNKASNTPTTFSEIIDNLYAKIVGGAQMSPPFFYSLTLRESKLVIRGYNDESKNNYMCSLYALNNAIGSSFGGKNFKYVDPFDSKSKSKAENNSVFMANGVDANDVDESKFNDDWDNLTATQKRELLFNK